MAQRKCLLITGTIVPNSTFVTQTNPQARRQEYLAGLRHYSSVFNGPIYFLENSSYDIQGDRELMSVLREGNIQLLRFPPSAEFEKGKGFQEFEMLDKAVQQLGDQFEAFIKVTGRYRIMNLQDLVPNVIESITIDKHKEPKVALTSCFCSTFNAYRKWLEGSYTEADDSTGFFIEKVIYQRLAGKPTELFSVNPKIKGTSGSYGESLHRNPLKMAWRNADRKRLRMAGKNEFSKA